MAAMVGVNQLGSCYCCYGNAVAQPRSQDAVVVCFVAPKSPNNVSAGSAQIKLGCAGGCSRCGLASRKNEERRRRFEVRAMAEGTSGHAEAETFEVELEKPFGLRFYKGSDGGTYIDAIQPGSNASETGLFTVGDKVISTSAVFGNEMWPAAEYGRTMYTIRQRIGTLAIKVEKRYGKREDQSNAADIAKERNAGELGDAVRQIQIQNYVRKQELQQQRAELLNDGLKLYKAGKFQDALEKFETVLGLKPDYREIAVASYNVSCCYSKLNELEAGLSALEEALEAGFEDYKTIREDPDLANLRESPNFKPLINKFDEPFFNESAFTAIKNVFGIFGKK